MTNNATRLSKQHCIVKIPESNAIVYKCANYPLIPNELHNHDSLVFQSVPDASSLTSKTVDRSGIDPESELADLMRENWGITDFS